MLKNNAWKYLHETQIELLKWYEQLCKGEIIKIEVELVKNGFVTMTAKYKKGKK